MTPLPILIIVLILAAFVGLNAYYLYVVQANSQEQLIRKGKSGTWDYVAIGSTYGRFGIDFQKIGINGWNFCFGPQFLYYTYKILQEYSTSFKKGCIVVVVLPDLVFASDGKYDYDGISRYRRILGKQSLGHDYSLFHRLLAEMPLLFGRNKRRIIKKIVFHICRRPLPNIMEGSKNTNNDEELELLAERRCQEWCQQFGLTDTKSSNIPPNLSSQFEESIALLKSITKFCLDNEYRPILCVPPLSHFLNEKTSYEFFKKILYDNIEAANITKTPVLDYREDPRFQDGQYYLNTDFLNTTGRGLFTRVLIQDIHQIYSDR